MNLRHPDRQSEKVWEDFPNSFHTASNCLTHRPASVDIDVCLVYSGKFDLAGVGGIHLSREVWPTSEGTASLAIWAALEGVAFSSEAKVGTDNFLTEIFCQTELIFLPNPTPYANPTPLAFGQVSEILARVCGAVSIPSWFGKCRDLFSLGWNLQARFLPWQKQRATSIS